MNSSKANLDELLQELESESDEKRREGARLVGELQEKKGIEPLIRLLSDQM